MRMFRRQGRKSDKGKGMKEVSIQPDTVDLDTYIFPPTGDELVVLSFTDEDKQISYRVLLAKNDFNSMLHTLVDTFQK